MSDDKNKKGSGATTGYEAKPWAMADALRGSMDASEYKHVVLGLIFLAYILDAFKFRYAELLTKFDKQITAERDEYVA